MGSDRARTSYDETRNYTALVAQQGRVTLEADWNEAEAIEAAGDRAVTLDVVGKVGTPDGGYAVTASGLTSGDWDLSVEPGTLYLGGDRLHLGSVVDLANQPDWRDVATDALWVAPAPAAASPPTAPANELVYLLAIEQQVSAVEDPALADVALGGPDTMQRLRVLQRFVRWSTQTSTCNAAWREVQDAWAGIGLAVDPATAKLRSNATLQVGFVTDPVPPSACQPVAAGGYLGAENQLIRVQIASVDADGTPTIVWGFDNAAFLYELAPVPPGSSGNLVLTLTRAPVDSYHHPVVGQSVELLRDAASLTPDDPDLSAADGHYIAAPGGPIFTVTQRYDSSSGALTVAGSLPAGYEHASQLYLRVWQGSCPAPAGTAVQLTGAGAEIGVTVTLRSPSGKFHPGDFWCFALRPSVPDLIYPARYGADPQPPDGPRVLACPVAMVVSEIGAATPIATVTSCIPPFDNLVELTASGGSKPFLTVEGVKTVTGTTLRNNGAVAPADLAKGIVVTFSDKLGIQPHDEPIFRFWIDLPYPTDAASREMWQQFVGANPSSITPAAPFIGTIPLSLTGTLAVSGPQLTWSPTGFSAEFLAKAGAHRFGVRPLTPNVPAPNFADTIKGFITIRGDAVWSADQNPRRYLNGEVLLTDDDQGRFSTASQQYDPQSAADFRMWFYLAT
jgi:hypothetical protein